MTIKAVQAFFTSHAPDIKTIELDASTVTVALAAQAHGVEVGLGRQTLLTVIRRYGS
ncbi:hypothetical protein H0A71_10980 [Alcaligenaceae bacterium]|nr:hypothetical protein [Alcaligenaceae bacterium]